LISLSGEVALEEEQLDLTLWRSRFGRGTIRSHPLEKSLWKRNHFISLSGKVALEEAMGLSQNGLRNE
jgi:hypothetical protein